MGYQSQVLFIGLHSQVFSKYKFLICKKHEIVHSTDNTQWTNAMEKSLYEKETWDLVQLPKDKTAVDSKRVFRIKRNANGKVKRYKARLVATSILTEQDYDETFSSSCEI